MVFDKKSLPDAFADADIFLAQLCEIYGVELAERILDQLGRESRHSFWINPFLAAGNLPVTDTQSMAPVDLGSIEPVPGIEGVWSVPRDSGITISRAAESAAIYIQNPSSLLAVKALAPQPNQEVLDLAAAPGGKTIAIAAAMGNTGRIAAVEPVKKRFYRLKANVGRCGVTNVDFYQRDGRGVGRVVPGRFDRVLLDAPCSSEARIRWFDPSSYGHWSQKKVREVHRKQKRLLRSAYAALKPGGRLVYSTCSFGVTENELVVDDLLKSTDAKLAPLGVSLPENIPGMVTWQNNSLREDLALSCRIIPNQIWDGFYIAAISKPRSTG